MKERETKSHHYLSTYKGNKGKRPQSRRLTASLFTYDKIFLIVIMQYFMLTPFQSQPSSENPTAS